MWFRWSGALAVGGAVLFWASGGEQAQAVWVRHLWKAVFAFAAAGCLMHATREWRYLLATPDPELGTELSARATHIAVLATLLVQAPAFYLTLKLAIGAGGR
jgi:hypothetical protein